MGDVYVEAGEVKGAVDKKFLPQAENGMKTAIAAVTRKAKSGMTVVKPGDGKGIRVNIIVGKLAQDGSNVTCSLIGELFELPSKQRFNPGPRANGKATVPGKIEAVAGDCVGKAVGDLMDNIGSAIAGSQAAPAKTGTAASKSPLVFVVLDFSYPKDAKDAQQDLKDKAKAAITDYAKKKIGQNPQRFTLDPTAFKQGSGMPAYTIQIRVEKFLFDAATKELTATVNGLISEYPDDIMRVPQVGAATSTRSGYSRPPREADRIQTLLDATDGIVGKATKWILDTHP